jgi:hypothetical protein
MIATRFGDNKQRSGNRRIGRVADDPNVVGTIRWIVIIG